MAKHEYGTIEQAIEDLKAGKVILCTDDPDRENEGDMICAAEFATQENINLMAVHGKGLICTPMSAQIAERLGLQPMVAENTDAVTETIRKLSDVDFDSLNSTIHDLEDAIRPVAELARKLTG